MAKRLNPMWIKELDLKPCKIKRLQSLKYTDGAVKPYYNMQHIYNAPYIVYQLLR